MSRGLGLAAAALATSALALSACSGGSGGAAGTTASSSTTSAADVSLAQSELLPPSAFPAGWQSQGAGSQNAGASVFGGVSSSEVRTITQCLGISSAQVDTSPAEAGDPQYDSPGSSATVSDTVDVFPSAAAARFDVSAAANPKLPTCFVQIAPSFEAKAPKSVHFGALSARDYSVPAVGDKDAGVALSVGFTSQGVSGTLHAVIVVVQKGRSESNLMFTDLQATPDVTIVDGLASAAADAMRSG